MHEIVIISGKGGTGKTSLMGAFAHLASNPIICDLDVDAPDLHMLLHPENELSEDFYSGHEAIINEESCTGCGLCADLCRFDAIRSKDTIYSVNPLKCEGCKVCVTFCPEKAIAFPERHCGKWYIASSRFGPMVHAQLFPGAENSGKLVAVLRQKARELAQSRGINLILCDGPPGIGCPVISSLTGTDTAVLVTEPTPSGIHDLKRVAELCRHFKIPAAVIINKSDLNPRVADDIKTWSLADGWGVAGEIPYDKAVTEAMVKGQVLTEYLPQTSPMRIAIQDAWKRIESIIQAQRAA
jgi:MinD superfamily P-loop ATPase